MPTTQSQGIILSAAPLAMCLGVYWGSDGVGDTIIVSPSNPAVACAGSEFRLLFNNVTNVNIKFNVATQSASTQENVDIEAGDGGIVRFPKASRMISGVDGTTITDPTKNENATGKASISFTTNQADLDSTSWTAFLNKVKLYREGYWLVILPTGFNYENRFVSSVKKADGWAYMLGKFAMDVDHGASPSPSSLQLEFVSYKFATSVAVADSILQAQFGLSWATSADDHYGMLIPGTEVTLAPVTLTTGEDGDSETIGLGDLVLKAA